MKTRFCRIHVTDLSTLNFRDQLRELLTVSSSIGIKASDGIYFTAMTASLSV